MINLAIRLVLSFWLPPLGVLLTVYSTKNRRYWHWVNLLINVALFLTLPILGKLHAIWVILYKESQQRAITQQPLQLSLVLTSPPNSPPSSPPMSQRFYHWVSAIVTAIALLINIVLGFENLKIQRQIHPNIPQETHSKKY